MNFAHLRNLQMSAKDLQKSAKSILLHNNCHPLTPKNRIGKFFFIWKTIGTAPNYLLKQWKSFRTPFRLGHRIPFVMVSTNLPFYTFPNVESQFGYSKMCKDHPTPTPFHSGGGQTLKLCQNYLSWLLKRMPKRVQIC